MKCLKILAALFFVFGAFPICAYAYINPGTSSMIMQFLTGIFVGGAFVFKMFWSKIRLFFETIFSKKRKSNR